ncbi:uncharacterized protein SEPMUDRAFT_66005 [Sphaerulina musiva SO2202]|uniref:Coenzyme Q-binding protein COQ10 START domain-containing protein n=1 Tax=Sphaerulina musiva (strain SO2202) TaxID=692275 RepID=M3AYR7_SPHMS|nr:uncharacterized protein SEPMUDRAFT_66005 [Sphaerulina musiva SO2202]EMF12697.1 hypothetical protein SEPMUDRAFT_66005 [Sphaerulina musiva SO2202]
MTRKLNLLLLVATTIPSPSHAQTYQIEPSQLVNIRCSTNNNNNKLPTPTYGDKHIIFTICVEREIQAPITQVYNTLLDFRLYSDWNSFVIDVQPSSSSSGNVEGEIPRGPAPLGTKVKFITRGLIGSLNTTSEEIVTVDQKDIFSSSSSAEGTSSEGTASRHAINAWRYDGVGQRAEHPNVLTDLGERGTRYVSFESYYGLLAPVTEVLKGKLKSAFEAQADDLKRFVEGGR